MKFLKKHKVFTIIIVLVIGLGLFGFFAIKGKVKDAESVTESGASVAEAQMQDLSSTVTADGKVESQHVVSVTTELTSKCTKLNVALGDRSRTIGISATTISLFCKDFKTLSLN